MKFLLTLEQAKELEYGDILCQVGARGSDGKHRRWKVSGRVQTWKTDASRIRLPLKHGMYSYDAITECDFGFKDGAIVCEKLIKATDCDCGN